MATVILTRCGTLFTITGPSVSQIFQLISPDAMDGAAIQVDEQVAAPAAKPSTKLIPDEFTWKVTSSSFISKVVFLNHHAGEVVHVYNLEDVLIGTYYCDWLKFQLWMVAKSAGQYFNANVKLHPL